MPPAHKIKYLRSQMLESNNFAIVGMDMCGMGRLVFLFIQTFLVWNSEILFPSALAFCG